MISPPASSINPAGSPYFPRVRTLGPTTSPPPAHPPPMRFAARLLPAFLALLLAPQLLAQPTERMTSRIETCEAILREFQTDPELAIPAEVLREAQAIVIVNQVKGGLILGLQYGYGVALARRDDGSWSIPVFIRAGEASLGLQLGGQRIETIYVLMDRDTVRRLFTGRFNIGVDARAVAGPRAFEAELANRDILTTPVLVYGRTQGLFAGATIRTGWIDRHDAANWNFYETPYVLPELLYGNFVQPPPQVRPLIDFVTRITR
jgi:SH3 domain-containing YSC84-like protein 1